MKIYRYMSTDELSQLVKGETLNNVTDHSEKRGTASTAKGFCFGIGDVEQAKKDLRRLRGIVNAEMLVVFEPKDITKFTPCKGRYVDYAKIEAEGKTVKDYPFGEVPNMMSDEYCIESYSMYDIKEIVSVIHNPDVESASENFGDFSKNIKELAVKILGLFSDAKIEAPPTIAMGALALASSSLLDVMSKNFEVSREELLKDYVDSIKVFFKD